MNVARVFPRRTKATPDDVYVSVTFTYDISKAEQLAGDWHNAGFTVKLGGPAFNNSDGNFIAGLYLNIDFLDIT